MNEFESNFTPESIKRITEESSADMCKSVGINEELEKIKAKFRGALMDMIKTINQGNGTEAVERVEIALNDFANETRTSTIAKIREKMPKDIFDAVGNGSYSKDSHLYNYGFNDALARITDLLEKIEHEN